MYLVVDAQAGRPAVHVVEGEGGGVRDVVGVEDVDAGQGFFGGAVVGPGLVLGHDRVLVVLAAFWHGQGEL